MDKNKNVFDILMRLRAEILDITGHLLVRVQPDIVLEEQGRPAIKLGISDVALRSSLFLRYPVYSAVPNIPPSAIMNHGTVAIAIVQHQVIIIQAARSHNRHDHWLDVYTYIPFGERLFLASPVPQARIAPSDLLVIFPFRTPTSDMIELPAQAYKEYLELSARHQLKHENMWGHWKARLHY